jgi:hypothetical protein
MTNRMSSGRKGRRALIGSKGRVTVSSALTTSVRDGDKLSCVAAERMGVGRHAQARSFCTIFTQSNDNHILRILYCTARTGVRQDGASNARLRFPPPLLLLTLELSVDLGTTRRLVPVRMRSRRRGRSLVLRTRLSLARAHWKFVPDRALVPTRASGYVNRNSAATVKGRGR